MKRAAPWLFVAWCAFFGLFAHGYVENTDTVVTMHAARAWWHRGEPGLFADDALLSAGERAALAAARQTMPGRNGEHYVQFAIGHQALLVPCVALGELCARAFPRAEERHEELHGDDPYWGGHFWVRFWISWLPVPFAALAAVLIFAIARALGAAPRDALIVMLATVLATQLGAGASETMSDVPGLALLLGMALCVVRYERAQAGARVLWLAGILGGATVLVRYPNAVPVLVLAGLAAAVAWRRRRRDLLALAAGAAPFVALLLVANWLRFGRPLETGYGGGADALWFDMPFKWGLPLVLGSPCKGLLWFSPAVWLAFTQSWRPARALALTAWLAFVAPMLLIAHTRGWSGAQCWGIRYATPSVVVLCAVMLALGTPWRRWPKSCALVLGLGALVTLGGVLAPYRGQQYLAHEAARVACAEEIARGVQTEGTLPDVYQTVPRYSPLHTHWLYAGLALRGGLEAGQLARAGECLFGITLPAATPPPLVEDRGFRHLWIVGMHELHGWSLWIGFVWLVGLVGFGVGAWRRVR